MALLPHGDLVDGLTEAHGEFYSTATIPAETYPGQDEDVEVVVVANVLVVNANMDEQLAYDVVRVMFENQDDLVAVHPAANELTLENAMSSAALEYHPGALRYFEEQGVGASPVASPEATPAS
jgi:TRAP transporter TAXI family solute receptor